MLNLILQLAPGGTQTPERAPNSLEAPAEPSPLMQLEILITGVTLLVALLIWIAVATIRRRRSRRE